MSLLNLLIMVTSFLTLLELDVNSADNNIIPCPTSIAKRFCNSLMQTAPIGDLLCLPGLVKYYGLFNFALLALRPAQVSRVKIPPGLLV